MKKVFIDTNVILDYVLQREHGAEAKAVVGWLVKNNVLMLMSVGGFYTMHYLIDKYLRKELVLSKANRISALRTLLTRILQTFMVAEHNNQSLLDGVSNLRFADIEDSCQYQLAQKCKCDLLVTLNIKDYSQNVEEGDGVAIMTPQVFIETYIK